MTKVEDIKDTTPPKIAWNLGFEEGIRHMTDFISELQKKYDLKIRPKNEGNKDNDKAIVSK